MKETMNIDKLVSEFETMLSELGNTYPTERWLLSRKARAGALYVLQGALEYDKTKKINPKANVPFFEPHVPLTREEKLAIKRAASLNWQIGRKLGKIRRGEV